MPQPDENKTPAALLEEIGRALYGDDWQRELTLTLGIRGKSLRQWLSGHLRLGPDHRVWDDLRRLLAEREGELRRAREELERWLQRNRGMAP